MNGYVTADEFVTLSHQFKERMQTANTFEEIREMWR